MRKGFTDDVFHVSLTMCLREFRDDQLGFNVIVKAGHQVVGVNIGSSEDAKHGVIQIAELLSEFGCTLSKRVWKIGVSLRACYAL